MIEKPQIMESEEQTAAVIHLTVPRSQMQETFTSAVHELMGVLEDRGIEPLGPVFAHHFEIDPEVFDFEVGFPVAEDIAGEGRVKPGHLPAATWERYLVGPDADPDPSAWRTELNRPLVE